MKQNKYFSPERFARLLRNDFLIHKKSYLFTLAGISIAAYALMYYAMITTKHVTINQYTGFIVFYMVGLGVVIGTAFPALTNQNKTSSFLLLPASTLEKYLVQFLIRIVIFIPVALLIFWICAHLAKASLIPNPEIGFDPELSISDFSFTSLFNLLYYKDIAPILLGIFSGYSLLFAGSVYFKRFAIPKTLIFFGIIVGVVALSFKVFSHFFFPVSAANSTINHLIYKISSDTENIKLYFYIIFGCPWLFFLPLAYFKLKEKEV
ncbi:MAG: hypothetical protein A2066_15040 [Bacteroidetes bacterium GWB2_41_8]|nr:MAG: hypothetical protein A2066_15040 [Bacteroidetes bacterium GWB2_41_8]